MDHVRVTGWGVSFLHKRELQYKDDSGNWIKIGNAPKMKQAEIVTMSVGRATTAVRFYDQRDQYTNTGMGHFTVWGR